MAKSLCPLLIKVSRALVPMLSVVNMSFIAIHENEILAKISDSQYPSFTILCQ